MSAASLMDYRNISNNSFDFEVINGDSGKVFDDYEPPTEQSQIQEGGGPLNFVINKLPFEMHLTDKRPDGTTRKYNFAGSGTKLKKRLNADDTPKEWSKPINELDAAAMAHDIAYRDHRTAKERHPYDIKLAKVANRIAKDQNATPDERRAANLVAAIMHGKVYLGLGDVPMNDERMHDIFGIHVHKTLSKIGNYLNRELQVGGGSESPLSQNMISMKYTS